MNTLATKMNLNCKFTICSMKLKAAKQVIVLPVNLNLTNNNTVAPNLVNFLRRTETLCR